MQYFAKLIIEGNNEISWFRNLNSSGTSSTLRRKNLFSLTFTSKNFVASLFQAKENIFSLFLFGSTWAKQWYFVVSRHFTDIKSFSLTFASEVFRGIPITKTDLKIASYLSCSKWAKKWNFATLIFREKFRGLLFARYFQLFVCH